MIDPAFRRRLEPFSGGRPIRTAFTATTGASIWWAPTLILGAIVTIVWIDDRIGGIAAGILAAVLMIAAAIAWTAGSTYALMLTDTELVLLDTPRHAPFHPRYVVKCIPIGHVTVNVSTSPSGFASVQIDDHEFDIPTRDFMRARRFGQLATTTGASNLLLS